MRILLTGNSPFCQTGYGIQPAQLALQLKALGHEVAIFAYYGHNGSVVNWMGIPVYPNPAGDYGAKWAKDVYTHFQADCIITLVDVWVMGEMPVDVKWFPWVPIDHQPVPPNVYKVLANHPAIYKPIAMSKFGQEELKGQEIDSFYCPHMIDCETYYPDPEIRKANREGLGWTDKFVIGKIGTNVRERKDWTSAFLALSKFKRNHPDVMMYCHTDAFDDRGRNLQYLRENLMIQDVTVFPPKRDIKLTGVEPYVMNAAFNSMDVYLSNSKGEGFGIPTVEAQAAGVPVIVSNNTAQPELCGGGWILKKMTPEFDEQNSWEGRADPDEICECLEEAYAEKQSGKLEERKKAAREFALQYDVPAVMKDYWIPTLKVIEKMIKTPVERHLERKKRKRNVKV